MARISRPKVSEAVQTMKRFSAGDYDGAGQEFDCCQTYYDFSRASFTIPWIDLFLILILLQKVFLVFYIDKFYFVRVIIHLNIGGTLCESV